MGKGSGNAKAGGGGGGGRAIIVWVYVLGLWALTQPTFGAVYNIGWTFNVNNWPQDKFFQAGDVLVFNYLNAWHNVVAVDKNGYDRCISSRDDRVYQSGRDEMVLNRGLNYFICTAIGHCQSGMKMAVYAA